MAQVIVRSGRGLYTATFVFLLLRVAAWPQTPETGAISGLVQDPSRSAIAQATVEVSNAGTGLSRVVKTNDQGTFLAGLLPPGQYVITVAAPGFEKAQVKDIRVVVTEVAVANVQLQVGSVTSLVDVNATAEVTQTTSAALGRVATSEVITELPLANRNFTQILDLSPGVAVELPDAGQLGKNDQNVSANGVRTSYNNFEFNGIVANNIAENSATGFGPEVSLAVPAPDTIAEFKVQTGQYDATSGRSAGANVDIISKSGTNAFHGTVWEFVRNEIFNANTFFLNRSEMKKLGQNRGRRLSTPA